MLFQGWILLVWSAGKAAPTAEGREASRQMDPHAHRHHVVGCRDPGKPGAGTTLPQGREAGMPAHPDLGEKKLW